MSETGKDSPLPAPSTDAKMMRYDADKKSTLLAYVFWFFLGPFGAHRFYLRNIVSGTALLLVTLACFVVTRQTYGAYVFVFIVPAVWLIVDVFLIPGKVRRFNAKLMEELSAAPPESR